MIYFGGLIMSKKEKVTDSNRELFWQRMIEARRDSGLSVARFCQKEGISQAAYYYWRKKLCDGVSPANEASSAAFLVVVNPVNRRYLVFYSDFAIATPCPRMC